MDNSYYESFFELTKGNYYSILGVPPKASQEEIKAAYRNAVKLYHPDLNNNSEASRQQFIRVQQAYEVLSDPQQRARYDAELQRRLELFLRGVANQSNQPNQTHHRPQEASTPTEVSKQPRNIAFLAVVGLIVLSIFVISYEGRSVHQPIEETIEEPVLDNSRMATEDYTTHIQHSEEIAANSADEYIANQHSTEAPTTTNDNQSFATNASGMADETVSPSVEYTPPVSLSTGAKPYAYKYGKGRYDSESMSYLEVKNSVETDAIVMLYDTRTGRVVRHAYLRAGATYKLRQLPSGIFDMRVYRGVNWNPNKYMGPNAPTGGFESEESFTACRPTDYLDMRHIESHSGISYPTYTVTLYTVRNGNFAMEETSSKTFFQ